MLISLDESPGDIVGGFPEPPGSMKPYMTMEVAPPSEIVTQIVEGDTLYFRRQRTDTGYVLIPIYRVRKLLSEAYYHLYFDSTDTMPAVERDTITAKQGQYLLNTE